MQTENGDHGWFGAVVCQNENEDEVSKIAMRDLSVPVADLSTLKEPPALFVAAREYACAHTAANGTTTTTSPTLHRRLPERPLHLRNLLRLSAEVDQVKEQKWLELST
ncbi:MAG: hypothetical protein R2911_29250 [Caldilineaceae bacterium]